MPIALAVAALAGVDGAWDLAKRAVLLLSSLDVAAVRAYVAQFGALAPVASFILMLLQAVIAPLPAFVITLANAVLFGWAWGALLSWSSALAGAALCFWIARAYGRGAVARFTPERALAPIDRFFARHGQYAVLLARLLPFMPFDPVSYAAGLTAMRVWPFLLATGVGQLPATLAYSYAGDLLAVDGSMLAWGLAATLALGVPLLWLLSRWHDRSSKAPEEPPR